MSAFAGAKLLIIYQLSEYKTSLYMFGFTFITYINDFKILLRVIAFYAYHFSYRLLKWLSVEFWLVLGGD